jgi:hypothetical protein
MFFQIFQRTEYRLNISSLCLQSVLSRLCRDERDLVRHFSMMTNGPLGHLSELKLLKLNYAKEPRKAMRLSRSGELGIRTPDSPEAITVFKTAAFDHSANSPIYF